MLSASAHAVGRVLGQDIHRGGVPMVVTAPDEPRLARRIGRCIKTARVSSGLPRNQVARSAGLTPRELSGYELGKKLPSRGDLLALAGACGIHVDELIPKELIGSLT